MNTALQEMAKLNPRQAEFARKIAIERKSQREAYSEAYNKPMDENTDSSASHLSSNPKVKKTIEELKAMIVDHLVQDSIAVQETMLRDTKTPANVRNDIAKHFQNIGGIVATQKVENKTETTFKGLTDSDDWVEAALQDIKARKNEA